jgi:hypothetical protein
MFANSGGVTRPGQKVMGMVGTSTGDGPLILIVGSADESRKDYDPPLSNAADASRAAEQIGAALAKAGCRIVVFSSDAAYIEADVVRGFAAASVKSATRRVQVRAPQGATGSVFRMDANHSKIIDPRPDQDSHWVAPFYRAMRDASGVVIIGGGRAALIVGHLALAMGIPLLTLACFGGSALRLWKTIKPSTDLPTQDECSEMGRSDWRPEYAPQLVKGLIAQIKRREIRERAQKRKPAQRAALGLVLVIMVVAILVAANGSTWSAALLFGIGPFAGAAGGVTRSVLLSEEEDRPEISTLLFGAVCGLIVSLVYLVAQFSASGGTGEIKQMVVAIVWMAVTAFGAGFAFDRTLKELMKGKLKPNGRGIAG